MMQNASFIRKIIYLLAIGLLLIPLSMIAKPSTRTKSNAIKDSGGKLAQLRDENKLSPSNIGGHRSSQRINEACNARIASVCCEYALGKVNEYKKKHDWIS